MPRRGTQTFQEKRKEGRTNGRTGKMKDLQNELKEMNSE